MSATTIITTALTLAIIANVYSCVGKVMGQPASLTAEPRVNTSLVIR